MIDPVFAAVSAIVASRYLANTSAISPAHLEQIRGAPRLGCLDASRGPVEGLLGLLPTAADVAKRRFHRCPELVHLGETRHQHAILDVRHRGGDQRIARARL